MSTAGPRPLLDRLWILYAVFVAGFAAYVIHLSATERIRDLFADDWMLHAVRISKPYLAFLFTSHNGHLIPATRLMLDADYVALGGRGVLPLGFSMVFVGASGAMLLALLRAGGSAVSPLRRTLAGFLCFCVLWAATHYGLLWGFSVHAPMTMVALLAAVYALIEFSLQPDGERRQSLLALGAIAATVATLSCATGVLAWGSLIAVALVARLPLIVTASLVAGAALSVVMLALVPIGETSALEVAYFTLGHPLALLRFTAAFLGGPIGYLLASAFSLGRDARDVASLWVGGFALVAFVAYGIRRLWRFEDRDRLGLLSIALMTFGVGAALLTALGRAWLPGNAYRFTLWSTLFWMGAAVALVYTVERGRLARLRVPLLVGLPCLSLLMLPPLETYLDVHRKIRRINLQNTLMALVGIRSDDHLRFAFGAPDVVGSVLPTLERDARGPFADPRRSLLGQHIDDLGPSVGATRCLSKMRRTESFRDEAGISARVMGSVLDTGSAHPPRFVVITDRAGTVRGLGNVLPAEAEQRATWYAYVVPDSPQAYVALAALEDGSFCHLGRFRVSEPATIDASRDGMARPERLDRP